MPESELMEGYVKRVLEHLGEESLSKVEEVLGSKLQEAQDQAGLLKNDIASLNSTIQQARDRVQKMGNNYADALSKAAGIAESLIALKFGDELKKENVKSKGNGSKDPSASVKKKRSKRSKSSRAPVRSRP